jgi:hypothetical protein
VPEQVSPSYVIAIAIMLAVTIEIIKKLVVPVAVAAKI